MPIPAFTIDAAAVGAPKLADATTLSPTVTHASGWSGTFAFTRRLDCLLYIEASLQNSAAMAAGTGYTVATIAWPTTVSVITMASVEIYKYGSFSVGGSGTVSFRPTQNVAANTTLLLHHLALLAP